MTRVLHLEIEDCTECPHKQAIFPLVGPQMCVVCSQTQSVIPLMEGAFIPEDCPLPRKEPSDGK